MQGVLVRRDSKPRQGYPLQGDFPRVPAGNPFGVFRFHIDHQPDRRQGLICDAPNAKATDLDEAGKGGGRADKQAAVMRLDMGAVVGDQAGKGQRSEKPPGQM